MKRLLCVISSMNAGGAETFLMKIYRKLDKDKYQMDFCINVKEKCFYEDEILSDGGKIFRIPAKSENFFGYKKGLFNLVKHENYQYVLRITSNCAGFLDLKIAKQAGAKVTIARSSNSSDGGGLKARITHKIARLLYGPYVDVKLAPSDLAAGYTFGNKAFINGKVNILKNGLDLDVYRFNENNRKKIREDFHIPEGAFVIGHIGRFNEQKNHVFLIDIFEAFCKKRPDAKLLLVGSGDLEEEIQKKVDSLHLTDNVIFAGMRSDIPALLSAMDVFVFPSLYEGMPNVVIEAQVNGLSCVISNTITREANITGKVEYIGLNASAEHWGNTLYSICKDRIIKAEELAEDSGYDINDVTSTFISLVYQ